MTSGSWFLFCEERTDQTPHGVALPGPTGKSCSQGAQPGELGLQLLASPWGAGRGVAASGSRETGLKGCLSLEFLMILPVLPGCCAATVFIESGCKWISGLLRVHC